MLWHTVGLREGCEVAMPYRQIPPIDTEVTKGPDWARHMLNYNFMRWGENIINKKDPCTEYSDMLNYFLNEFECYLIYSKNTK